MSTATSRSKIAWGGGRGKVYMNLDDNKSMLLEMENMRLEATNAFTAHRGSLSRFPLAYTLGEGEVSIEGTLSQVIDEDRYRALRGYTKIAKSDAVKGEFMVMATVTGGEVDLSGGLPQGASVEEDSLYVVLNDTGEDLAGNEYTLTGNELTGMTDLNDSVVVVRGIYTMDSYEWAYNGEPENQCLQLKLVFPLSRYDCTAEKSVRVILVPRAYIIPDMVANAEEAALADTIKFRVVPDAAGYLFYESVM